MEPTKRVWVAATLDSKSDEANNVGKKLIARPIYQTYLKSFFAVHSPVSIAVSGWPLMKRLDTGFEAPEEGIKHSTMEPDPSSLLSDYCRYDFLCRGAV
jgi:hypothetical protein